jgi:hypothetical protein
MGIVALDGVHDPKFCSVSGPAGTDCSTSSHGDRGLPERTGRRVRTRAQPDDIQSSAF